MKSFFLAFLCTACLSCKESTTIPEGTLSEAKMADILMRIHIAEARISIKNLPADSSRKYFAYLKNDIMKRAGTDTIIFNKSYHYYAGSVETLDRIYTVVIDSLSMRETMKRVD